MGDFIFSNIPTLSFDWSLNYVLKESSSSSSSSDEDDDDDDDDDEDDEEDEWGKFLLHFQWGRRY